MRESGRYAHARANRKHATALHRPPALLRMKKARCVAVLQRTGLWSLLITSYNPSFEKFIAWRSPSNCALE